MKKIYLWWPFESPDLISCLEENGFIVARVFQGKSDLVLSHSIENLFSLHEYSQSNFDEKESEIFKDIFQRYHENISRISLTPPTSNRKNFGLSFSNENNISFDEAKNLFHFHYWFFRTLLSQDKPHAVWFSRPPHLGLDDVCYAVCRQMKIKTLIFHQSLFPKKFFFGRNIDELFDFPMNSEIFEGKPTLKNYRDLNLFYMKKKPSSSSKKRLKLIHFLSRQKLFMRGKSLEIRALVRPVRSYVSHRSFESFSQDLIVNRKELRYKKAQYLFDSSDQPLPEKFIYFPLHLQPEATTSALGGIFSNQTDAIEALSRILPDDWKLVVKENPKQNYFYRSKYFFKRLNENSRVFYVGGAIDSLKLIKEARIVATITGTAGFEALLNRKPVIYFGNAWYKNVRGAFPFHWNIDINKISNQSINLNDVWSDVLVIQQRCADGVIYSPYSELTEDSDESIASMTASSLAKIDANLFLD